MKIFKYTFLFSAVVFILLQIFYYTQLPDSVAVHFNLEGEVNGWMGKDSNLILSCLVIVVITLILAGIPYLIKHASGNLLSIPKKEYWLSSDKKEQLIKIVSKYIYAIGLATNLLMIYTFHQIYRFNIHATDRVSIIAIVPFLVITLGLTIHLLIRLNKCA